MNLESVLFICLSLVPSIFMKIDAFEKECSAPHSDEFGMNSIDAD